MFGPRKQPAVGVAELRRAADVARAGVTVALRLPGCAAVRGVLDAVVADRVARRRRIPREQDAVLGVATAKSADTFSGGDGPAADVVALATLDQAPPTLPCNVRARTR